LHFHLEVVLVLHSLHRRFDVLGFYVEFVRTIGAADRPCIINRNAKPTVAFWTRNLSLFLFFDR
tara:strand:+ start:526 stop:717 length:192 start_codon:yes stop_codon:yes gene_type:complete